jgi:hypothetical protein
MAVNDANPAPKWRKTYSNPFQEYLKENCYVAPTTEGHDSLEPFEDEYQHWISNHESSDGQVRDLLDYWHQKGSSIHACHEWPLISLRSRPCPLSVNVCF